MERQTEESGVEVEANSKPCVRFGTRGARARATTERDQTCWWYRRPQDRLSQYHANPLTSFTD